MTNHTYGYISLTMNMKRMMTGNGNHVTAKSFLGKLIFGGVLAVWNHCAPCAGSSCLAGWLDGWLAQRRIKKLLTNPPNML